jgi:hypothetical protein
MIVYVNGDSHAAAAEAAVPYGWAEDDPFFYGLGKRPHPENERVSFGCEIANHLNAVLQCDAQSGASNARILRTTRQWIDESEPGDDVLLVVQWSTWEREEWLIDGEYYQVGASGTDSVPETHQQQYKEFVAAVDWIQSRNHWHNEIWNFHRYLQDLNISHVFFNGNNHFEGMLDQRDWGVNYMSPYDPNLTYNAILRQSGYKTVNENSWHFGEDAHRFWAQFMLKYAYANNLIG